MHLQYETSFSPLGITLMLIWQHQSYAYHNITDLLLCNSFSSAPLPRTSTPGTAHHRRQHLQLSEPIRTSAVAARPWGLV